MMRHAISRKASPAAAVLRLAREMRSQLKGKKGAGYLGRLANAAREHRPNRASPKTKRDWPSKTKHTPPRPPESHPLTEELDQEMEQASARQTAVWNSGVACQPFTRQRIVTSVACYSFGRSQTVIGTT